MKSWSWAGAISAVLLLVVSNLLAFAAGAKNPDTAPVAAPTPIIATPAVMPLPGVGQAIAEISLQQGMGQLPVDWIALRAVYDAGRSPIWALPTGFTPLGQQFMQLLPKALQAGFGLPPEAALAVTTLPPPIDAATAARAEALLSVVFMTAAVDAGSLIGDAAQRGLGILAALDQSTDQPAFLQQEVPVYPPFWRLYRQLPGYIAYVRAGGWPTIGGIDKLEPGQRHASVVALRQRLVVTGDLIAAPVADPAADPELYDGDLVPAVQAFQRSHGLNDDGVIGKRTVEEMNVPAETRLRMIMLNLQRMQEQGPGFEPRHLIVNVPAQEVKIIEDGNIAFYTKAIVGKVERKTPLLNSIITQVKLNPDWSVPPKIAANDMLRHELDQPGYFVTKNVRVYDSGGGEVDANTIDWREVRKSGYFPYRLKQDAGPENALGPVKLDFKNDYAVYLHGTSAPALFAKQDRYFSSGCVRTADPVGLAAFVLKDNPVWTRSHVDEVIASGKTTYVAVARPLPIHITYMTAWVDEGGILQFRRDAYGYDRLPSMPNLMPDIDQPSVTSSIADRSSGRN
ncbi:MAG: L,D-transpeptidase family protein [Dongiaceae bacterium]